MSPENVVEYARSRKNLQVGPAPLNFLEKFKQMSTDRRSSK